MMETPHSVCQAPNGNGGVYAALRDYGCLADMDRRGVMYAHFYGVDNALVKIADPIFVGYCVEASNHRPYPFTTPHHTTSQLTECGCSSSSEADCANKVVLKRDWSEKVGVMCLRNGKSSVIEYSEITEAMAKQKGNDGRLAYGAANIVNHFFTVAFLKQIAADPFALPYVHRSTDDAT